MPYTAFVGGVGEGDGWEWENQTNRGSVATPQRLRDLALERALESVGTHPKGQTPIWVKGNPEEPSPTWSFSK